jgi:hypothetical protein
MAQPRPPLRRPKMLWGAAAVAILLAIAGGPWPLSGIAGAALVLLVVVVLGGAWLLAPWSRTARNIVLPDLDTFDRRLARTRRLADALGRIPVLGRVWRWAQRLTTSAVERGIEEQRAMIQQHYGQRDDGATGTP